MLDCHRSFPGQQSEDEEVERPLRKPVNMSILSEDEGNDNPRNSSWKRVSWPFEIGLNRFATVEVELEFLGE